MDCSAGSNRLYSHQDAGGGPLIGYYQAIDNTDVEAISFPDKRTFFAVKTFQAGAVKTLRVDAVRTLPGL
jgi:hypothetical protein